MAATVIYVTRQIWQDVRRQLERVGSVIAWDEARSAPPEELIMRVQQADALICTSEDRITRDVISAGRRLRVISTMSTGLDHIDLDAAAERGIVVCHAPAAADEAVADMTMALLLACARNVVGADNFVHNRQWQYWAPDLFLGVDVQGSTIGIIGLGHTGILVAHRALGFGMRVLYADPQRNVDAEQRLGVQYGALDDVLREADFVTIHTPWRPETRGLLTATRLQLMKRTAFLINTAHSEIVDHAALTRALREGWIAGAGLDVFNETPISPDDPLLDLPNVVLSPNIGANTVDGIGTMMRMAAEQVIDVLQGRTPAHAVPTRKAA